MQVHHLELVLTRVKQISEQGLVIYLSLTEAWNEYGKLRCCYGIIGIWLNKF